LTQLKARAVSSTADILIHGSGGAHVNESRCVPAKKAQRRMMQRLEAE